MDDFISSGVTLSTRVVAGLVAFFAFFFVMMAGFALWADKRARHNAVAKAEAKRLLEFHKAQRRRALARNE